MWRKYIDARIRGSFINIVAVISLSRLAWLRPLDIQMSTGISGLARFSASKYYLPPSPLPLTRCPSSIRKKKVQEATRVDFSIADLFIPARLNDSITDRARSLVDQRPLWFASKVSASPHVLSLIRENGTLFQLASSLLSSISFRDVFLWPVLLCRSYFARYAS